MDELMTRKSELEKNLEELEQLLEVTRTAIEPLNKKWDEALNTVITEISYEPYHGIVESEKWANENGIIMKDGKWVKAVKYERRSYETDIPKINPELYKEHSILQDKVISLEGQIRKLKSEITAIESKMKAEKDNRMKNDLATVRNNLDVNFDYYTYTAGEDPSMMYRVEKSSGQLGLEYNQLLMQLDSKLERGEISEEQYDNINISLANLYKEYRKKALDNAKENRPVQQQSDAYVDIEDLGDIVDLIDADLLKDRTFIKMFRTYGMQDATQEDIDMFINNYRRDILGETKFVDKSEVTKNVEHKIR